MWPEELVRLRRQLGNKNVGVSIARGQRGAQKLHRADAPQERVRRTSLAPRHLVDPLRRATSGEITVLVIEHVEPHVLAIADIVKVVPSLRSSPCLKCLQSSRQVGGLIRLSLRNFACRTHRQRHQNRKHYEQRLCEPEGKENFEENAS